MDEINIGFIGLGNMGQHMCLALFKIPIKSLFTISMGKLLYLPGIRGWLG
ncbi:MAG: hypothetical protein CM1200mP3_14820 [Chloroflexota bacterium]|nr:MAG: hypothetical protein CM1200mP3_14820 [Chloroflexota bacterium]